MKGCPQALNGELGLRTRAASVSRVGMAREFYGFVVLELQSLLEALSDLVERLLSLLRRPPLSALARDCLADRARPETNSVESSANIYDDAHDFIIFIVFNVFANSREHDVKPQCVDVDSFLVLELERPFATMFVLSILPLWSDTLLEEVVIRFESKIGCGSDVVLQSDINSRPESQRALWRVLT